MPNFKLVAKAKTPAGSNMTLLFSLLSNCKHNVWCSRELTLKAKNSHFLKATFKDLYKILTKRHINYRLVLIFTLFPQWVANQAWEEVGEKTNQVFFFTTILFRNLSTICKRTNVWTCKWRRGDNAFHEEKTMLKLRFDSSSTLKTKNICVR